MHFKSGKTLTAVILLGHLWYYWPYLTWNSYAEKIRRSIWWWAQGRKRGGSQETISKNREHPADLSPDPSSKSGKLKLWTVISVVKTAAALGWNSTSYNKRMYSVGIESELFKSRCKWGVFTYRKVYSCEIEEEKGYWIVIAKQWSLDDKKGIPNENKNLEVLSKLS